MKNLLRLSTLRDKYDALALVIHACLVEKGFRCVGCGEEVCTNREMSCFHFQNQLLFFPFAPRETVKMSLTMEKLCPQTGIPWTMFTPCNTGREILDHFIFLKL